MANRSKLILAYSAILIACPALVFAAVSMLYGSPANLLARLQGRSIVIDRDVIDLGGSGVGEAAEGTFTLTNLSTRPIAIIGIQSGCGCLTSEFRPPSTIRPGSSLLVPVKVQLPEVAGPYHESLRLYTDRPGQRYVDLAVVADVRQPD